jgi:hypothetical protein
LSEVEALMHELDRETQADAWGSMDMYYDSKFAIDGYRLSAEEQAREDETMREYSSWANQGMAIICLDRWKIEGPQIETAKSWMHLNG